MSIEMYEALKKAEKRIAELEDMHGRNIEQFKTDFKHRDDGHHCGWRVIAEAMAERSKSALEKDKS